MHMGDSCTSRGIPIDGTRCGGKRRPCKVAEATVNHRGLYNIMCECNGGASGNTLSIWQIEQDITCDAHADCPTNFYCDMSRSCYDQSLCHRAKDSIDGSCPDTLQPTSVPTGYPSTMPT